MSDAAAKREAYALAVKGSQPGLTAANERALATRPGREATTTDRHGDRIEVRTLVLVDAVGVRWPGAAQVGRLERVRNVAGDVTNETTLVVTGLPATAASAEAVLGLVRGHWGIENRLHFVRDVVLGEDACRVRSENAPHVFAAVRNAALNLLRGAGHGKSPPWIEAGRRRASARLARVGAEAGRPFRHRREFIAKRRKKISHRGESFAAVASAPLRGRACARPGHPASCSPRCGAGWGKLS